MKFERRSRPCARFIVALLAAGLIWQIGPVDAAPNDPKKAPIRLDLSGALLSQTNCKTSVGCGHPHVTIGVSSVISESTAASPAQHILSLRLSDASQLQQAGHLPYSLDVEYELLNPSGHKNNLLCASAVIDSRLVQRCANPYTTAGRLSVPLHAPPTTIALQFGLMPWSTGHRFAVKNVQLSFGKQPELAGTPKREVDFTAGRLQQRGCATPVGCAHKAVMLTSNAFRSSVAGEIGPQPPAPNDNPNLPPPSDNPAADRRLSLEIPVPAHGKGLRTLSFSYLLQTAAQGGSQIVVTARGRTIVESVIDEPGSGLVSMELPHSSLPIESVTFAFVPRGGAPSIFAVSDAGLGPRPAVGSGPLPTSEDDEGSGGLSRLDPCGPELLTFWVTAADSREGRGIRCVSRDLRSWYGEGWWIDPAYGYYRHLGYIPDETFNFAPGFAIAVDFGVMPLLAGGDDGRRVAYGTDGAQILHIDRLAADSWHVSTPARSWNEYWQLVPKTELLPGFFGNVRWERECGSFGLHSFEALLPLGFLKRCAMPADLTADPDDLRRTSQPLVWYGESYLQDSEYDDVDGPERTHLGWLRRFAERPSPLGFYAASDRCLALPRIGFCTSFDEVTAEVIGNGASDYPPGTPQDSWENEWFRVNQGLFVVGPGFWRGDGGDGHGWSRLRGLPPDASLPPPTPICVDDCPD